MKIFLFFLQLIIQCITAAGEENNKLDLDMLGKGSMSALHYAAQLGETKIIGRLLQAGKAQLVNSHSNAHWHFVVDVGATRSLLNDKSHSALDIAVTNGHLESANVLRFDPAKVSICLAAKHGLFVPAYGISFLYSMYVCVVDR